MSLRSLLPLLRQRRRSLRPRRRPLGGHRRARAGPRLRRRRPGPGHRPPPDRRRRPDRHRRRSSGPRSGRLPRARARWRLFPAWETLPFERVSPSVETMGRRLRAMWRLSHRDDTGRLDQVAPGHGRAGAGPAAAARTPRRGDRARRGGRPGTVLDPADLVARLIGQRLPPRVPGRASRRARRAGLDRRRVPVDRRRAGPHRPVGRRGGPADRVLRRRPALDRRPRPRRAVRLPRAAPDRRRAGTGRPPRRRPAVGPRSSGSASPRAWSSTAWSPGCRGSPTDERTCSSTCCPTTPRSCWSSPGACATGPSELLDEEAALAATLASTWGAGGEEFPRLHLPFDRLLAADRGPGLDGHRRARGPRHRAWWRPRAGIRWWATATGCASSSATSSGRGLPGRGLRRGPGQRRPPGRGCSATRGITAPLLDDTLADGELLKPGVRIIVQPLDRGFVYPALKLAVLAEGDLTGRRRAHRRPGPGPGPPRPSSTT